MGILAAASVCLLGGVAVPANAGTSVPTKVGEQKAPTAELEWGECPEFGGGYDESPTKAFLECTTVEVPLDYANPGGETIEIAVSRLASANPEERRGVLLLNPGGPGGPGLPMPLDLTSLSVPASVLDEYDLIGFDPRGVGYSSPVDCGIDFATYNSNVPPYARGPEDVAAQAEVARGVAEQCAAQDTAGRLQHYSTANTARDMDVIRKALGEQKISYFGVSYGTVLGSAYASLYPERTDRFVLDSNVGGTALDRDGFRRFGLGAEERFPDFAKWAAKRDGTYELGSSPRKVREKYFELAELLDEQPFEGVTGALFRMQTFGALYSDASFPQLAQFWQAVDRGATTEAKKLAKELAGAAPAAGYTPENLVASQLAIVCNDSEYPRSVAEYRRDVEIDRARFPIFGAASANIVPCAYWPSPLEPRVEISSDGPDNILLLQNLRDPATPYVGGLLMRHAFGDRATLVSVDQGGHGTYLFGDNACANNLATRYLVDGELPKHDKFCGSGRGWFGTLDKAEQKEREQTIRSFHDRQLF